jgi:hypothetical protein
MWIKCGDGTHLLNASQVLHFNVEAAAEAPQESGEDSGQRDSGVLVIARMADGVPICVGRYETEEHANLVLNTISAAFESGARTLDVHRLRTKRRGAEGA